MFSNTFNQELVVKSSLTNEFLIVVTVTFLETDCTLKNITYPNLFRSAILGVTVGVLVLEVFRLAAVVAVALVETGAGA